MHTVKDHNTMVEPVTASAYLSVEGNSFEYTNATYKPTTVHIVNFLRLNTLTLVVGSKPDRVTAYRVGLTTVGITWNTPFPPNKTAGYEVYYTGPTTGSVTANELGAKTDKAIVSGLLNGGVYTFFVAGKSAHFETERVAANNGQIYYV